MGGLGQRRDDVRGSSAFRRALCAASAGALLAVVCGCGTDAASGEDRERTAVQEVLDRQSAAVRGGTAEDYLAAVDRRSGSYRAAQRQVFDNLRALPLTQWSYTAGKVRHVEGRGGDRVEADVRLRYRLRGDDRAPVTATERLAFTERGGRWYVSAELRGSERQLWEQGRITVVRGERSMVLGVGRGEDALRALARDADRAVTAVNGVWKRQWPHRVVLEAPTTLHRMAQLLDAPASSYEGIAAVTTGESGGSAKAPADRIVINPEAYGLLSEDGRQVVVTHETVHVATRTHTGPATPMWLSEGLADWIGYRGTDRTPKQAAAELQRAAEKDGLPRELPSDRDFKFGSDPEALGEAYESGWLACRLIAEEWSEEKLLDFYLRVGRSGKAGGAGVERAMRDELGVTRAEFTERWRSYVRDQLS